MLAEQRENFNVPENTREILLKKHDHALEEASEISDRIRRLEQELDLNSRKNFPQADKSREREIEQEYNELAQELAGREAELEKKWEEINQIQAELLTAEKA